MAAWLMMTTERPVLIGAGYDDDAARYYSWDSTVQRHSSPAVGDSIVLWDKDFLLGVSAIDVIEKGSREKMRFRCPNCGKTKLQRRKTKKPEHWCSGCKSGSKTPIEELIEVDTYKSHHESSWIDLEGALDARSLRQLCTRPKSQHAIRELKWDLFVQALGDDIRRPVAKIASAPNEQIPGGHKPRVIRARRGQAAFRRQLRKMYGDTCALSGTAPKHVLDAAHLYSYAETGEHDTLGGLLIRKDLHRLFDLGFITVDPGCMKIHVDASLLKYPSYKILHGKKIAVDVHSATKKWIRIHWEFWQIGG